MQYPITYWRTMFENGENHSEENYIHKADVNATT